MKMEKKAIDQLFNEAIIFDEKLVVWHFQGESGNPVARCLATQSITRLSVLFLLTFFSNLLSIEFKFMM